VSVPSRDAAGDAVASPSLCSLLDRRQANVKQEAGSPSAYYLVVSGCRRVAGPSTSAGDKAFHEVTKNEAVRGRTLGLVANCAARCAFAIVLDDEIRAWPEIDPTQFPHGIDPAGGGAQITGMGDAQAARDLALVLQTGGLPAQLVVLSERAVQ
jgi:hypothetical protein